MEKGRGRHFARVRGTQKQRFTEHVQKAGGSWSRAEADTLELTLKRGEGQEDRERFVIVA